MPPPAAPVVPERKQDLVEKARDDKEQPWRQWTEIADADKQGRRESEESEFTDPNEVIRLRRELDDKS